MSAPVGTFFAVLDAGSQDDTSTEILATMSDAVVLLAPSVVALAVIGLLTRAAYVRGRAVLAGALAGGGWVATMVGPLVLLDPSGAGGPTTLRVLAAGTSAGLGLGAVLLVLLVARKWGWSALVVPARPLLGAVLGAAVSAVLGRVLASALLERGIGGSLAGSLVLGVGVGAGALALMVGLALAVDPSLVRRLREARRNRVPVPGGRS